MVRIAIIGIVIAVAFTLYALVDAAMSDGARARGVGKPVWVVLVVVLPVLGGILWFTIGKGTAAPAAPAPTTPDDDPRFSGSGMSDDELDNHMRDLEARLRELDEETFPGEAPAHPAQSAADGRANVGDTPEAHSEADRVDENGEDPDESGRGKRSDGDAAAS